MNSMVTIGFSRASTEEKYQLYINWLKSIDASFEYLNFYGMEVSEAISALEKCSGLVLTGGPDVHPLHFGKAEEANRCEIDTYRDSLEFSLIEKAMALKLPILAICRGEQMLNVSQGGDLIIDIPTDFKNAEIHKSETKQLKYHTVTIDLKSELYNMAKVSEFEVVSTHHQAVKTLAKCFKATAFTADGIIEAFEWQNTEKYGYLNAIQWHPEKGDFHNLLSQAIGKDFIKNAYSYSEKQ